jgi:hypothetical protein
MSEPNHINTLRAARDEAAEKLKGFPNSPYLQRAYSTAQKALDKAAFAQLKKPKASTPARKPATPLFLFTAIIPGPDQLKYRIKIAFIQAFGSEQAVRKAKTLMPGIPVDTIDYHMNLRMNEAAQIGDVTLQLYALYTGFNIDYLKADYHYFLSQQKKTA